MLGTYAPEPVEDPLAAPGIQAQVRVSQATLAAYRVLQEDVVLGRAVPLHGVTVVDLVLVAVPREPRSERPEKAERCRPVASRPDDDIEFHVLPDDLVLVVREGQVPGPAGGGGHLDHGAAPGNPDPVRGATR